MAFLTRFLRRFDAVGISRRTALRIAVANLCFQVLIVVTGGAVRLTGSGLGCETWPQCQPGSFVPVMHEANRFQEAIEFGNRLLTFLVLAGAIAVLIAARSHFIEQRRSLRRLALVPLIGTVAQAVVGGIVVRLTLHPAWVGLHFLVSSALIAASTVLLIMMARGPVRRPESVPTPQSIAVGQFLAITVSVLCAAVIVLGVIVTGAGPHSGDLERPARLAVDPRMMSWLHADVVIAYVCVLLTIALTCYLGGWSARTRWWAKTAIAVALAQGLIGYVQYFTQLPIILVGLHMLGSGLVVIATTGLVFAIRDTIAEPVDAASPRSYITGVGVTNGSKRMARNNSVK